MFRSWSAEAGGAPLCPSTGGEAVPASGARAMCSSSSSRFSRRSTTLNKRAFENSTAARPGASCASPADNIGDAPRPSKASADGWSVDNSTSRVTARHWK